LPNRQRVQRWDVCERLVLALALIVWLPGPAQADSPRLWSVVDAGHGDHGVAAEMTVAAPVSVVWAVLTDCATAPEHVPGMVSCKVLQSDPAGLWDIREHRVRLPWLPLVLRNVVRSDYVPQRRLDYRKLGRDVTQLRGQWRLSPDASGAATQIEYTGYMTGLLPVPDGMAKAYVLEGLIALQAESLKRAGAPAPVSPAQPTNIRP